MRSSLLSLATAACGLAHVALADVAVATGCGAVASATSAAPVTAVVGTFNIPSTTPGAQLDIQLSIDDDQGGCAASLMVGANIVNTDGSAVVSVFYFWYPNYSATFPGFTANESDELQVNITTTSASSAIVTVTDTTTNMSASEAISGNALCRSEALWGLYLLESTIGTSGAFGDVLFQNSYALTSDGAALGIAGATLIDENGCSSQEVDASELLLTPTG